MENNTFTYRYSAARCKEIESIRQRYLPQEENKFERLKALDRRVQGAGRLASLSVGVIGALVFSIGMCFGLDVFAGGDWLTVLFCVLGCGIMTPAYPLYKHLSRKTRARLTPDILRLSEEIMRS